MPSKVGISEYPVAPEFWNKCSPVIGNTLRECGTVTLCDAIPMESGDAQALYMQEQEGGGYSFRVMEHLFAHDFEIAMCEAVQNSMADFLMSLKVAVNTRITTRRLQGGELEIAPFITARQQSPINDAYWLITTARAYTAEDDSADFSTADLVVEIASSTNIPWDTGSFPAGMRVYITGQTSGGMATHTSWQCLGAAIDEDGGHMVYLVGQNAGSFLESLALTPPGENGSPVKGWMVRGGPNVSDFEKWCAEQPTYTHWHDVPFWIETMRTTSCKSSNYEKWRAMVAKNNRFYREFYDLTETEKNRQLDRDWKNRQVNTLFWGKAINAGQTLGTYALPELAGGLPIIEAFEGILDANGNQIIGVDGGRCVGRKANLIGWYEQMAQCGRVMDLGGLALNIPALCEELYNMYRVRKANGKKNPHIFDCFTDSRYGKVFNDGMIAYYLANLQGQGHIEIPISGVNVSNPDPQTQGPSKTAKFGFTYRSYELIWPAGLILNIITHEYFDDRVSVAKQAGMEAIGRVFWVLDFTQFYPGIIATNSKTWDTGELAKLAAINESYGCVLEVNTKQQKLTSMTWTAVVECPMGSLMLENLELAAPNLAVVPGLVYPGSGTTTTTTTLSGPDQEPT